MYHDPDVKHSLWVTTKYSVVSVPLRMAIALFLAVLLNEATKLVGLFSHCVLLAGRGRQRGGGGAVAVDFEPAFWPLQPFVGSVRNRGTISGSAIPK